MKKIIKLLCAIIATGIYSTTFAACPSEPGCTTNWLNVPGDFANSTNNFTMYLLNGWFSVADPSGSAIGYLNPLNTTGQQISFTASQFDHNGTGQGTSTLNANFNHIVIGSGEFMGNATTIYINGTATGTLVDNADSTKGQWILNTHLYADWGNNQGLDLGIMPLSTNASYAYKAFVDFPETNTTEAQTISSNFTAIGSNMDYHSGMAYMVAQGTTQGGPFPGFIVTVGLEGQDPLATPLPSALWLLGSGLLGLVGVARKHKAA